MTVLDAVSWGEHDDDELDEHLVDDEEVGATFEGHGPVAVLGTLPVFVVADGEAEGKGDEMVMSTWLGAAPWAWLVLSRLDLTAGVTAVADRSPPVCALDVGVGDDSIIQTKVQATSNVSDE